MMKFIYYFRKQIANVTVIKIKIKVLNQSGCDVFCFIISLYIISLKLLNKFTLCLEIT